MGDPHLSAARHRYDRRMREARTPAARSTRPSAQQRRTRRAPATRQAPPAGLHVLPDGRTRLVVPLPWTSPPLSLNHRLGWAAIARTRAGITDATEWLVREVDPLHFRVEAELLWYRGSDEPADSDNTAASMKPIMDALVPRVLADDGAAVVVRTSQRVVLRRDDPAGATEPRMLLVVTQAQPERFEHYGPAGEVIT